SSEISKDTFRQQIIFTGKSFAIMSFNVSAPDMARLFCAGIVCLLVGIPTLGLVFSSPEAPAKVSGRTLTFVERVAYQRAIEEVRWRHRIWPKENPGPKPPFQVIISVLV